MKKHLSRIFPCLLIALLPLSLFAACSVREISGNLEFTRNDDKQGYTLAYYTDSSVNTVLEIPGTFNGLPVTAIGELAIQSCDNLFEIRIGANITSIDKWGITGCRRLQKITVSPANTVFCDVDGVLFSKDKTILLSYPNANTAEYTKAGDLRETVSYAVPEGVTAIAHAAFYKCYALREITLPSTLKTIEPRAFQACEQLESINIPEGVTTIGSDAFLNCVSLSTITLPKSLLSVGDYVFYNCDKLDDMTIYASEIELQQGKRWLPERDRKAIAPKWIG
ncbi:MAG: leucine-rich repeat domain-containing protein [Oscillospiraceae bacterium]|jgi:hypothetical protein|nr:leucine-rich repeat domain-containing protein [Oscillospiraceae bacterium]